MNVTLEPAFVLHTKPYRETSLLVDCFMLNHGRISALARSARGTRSRFKGCLVPFAPLLISGNRKTDLMQITTVEVNGAAYFLQGKNLFNGIYLNELLIKLLPRDDACPQLYRYYDEALKQLQNSQEEPQKILRIFEKYLLSELGYGLHLSQEASGKKVQADNFYFYNLEQGILPCEENKKGVPVFRGSHLLAIEKNNFETSEILKDARTLMRLILGTLLGSKPLKSRELFI